MKISQWSHIYMAEKKKKKQSRSGFTLVELLIATSIFSIVAVTMYSAFSSGLSAWRRGSSGSILYQEARLELERMASELRCATLYTAMPDEEEKRNCGFEGEAERISFYIPLQIYSQEPLAQPEIYKLSYSLQEKDGRKSLIRKRMSFIQSVQPKPKAEVDELFFKVENLSFSYAYKTDDDEKLIEWKEIWEDKDHLPMGVKIELTLKDEASAEELTLKKYVLVRTGIIGQKEEITEEIAEEVAEQK